jgi:hypothetical protein
MKEDDTMNSVSQLFLCDDVKVLIFCFSPLLETVAGKYYALKRRYGRSRDSKQACLERYAILSLRRAV